MEDTPPETAPVAEVTAEVASTDFVDLQIDGEGSLSASSHQRASTRLNRQWHTSWTVSGLEDDNAKITVKDPEMLGSLLSGGKYLVYCVGSNSNSFVVRRRFSDFQWLREVLASRYVGMVIPSLPTTTRSTGPTVTSGSHLDPQSEYVLNRMAHLNLFMTALANIPFIRADAAYVCFVSQYSDKEFKDAKEEIKAKTLTSDTSPGAVAWKAILASEPTPQDVDVERSILEVRGQLDTLKTSLSQMDAGALALMRRSEMLSKDMSMFNTQVASWSDTEKELGDAMRGECLTLYGDKMKKLLDALVNGCDNWATHMSSLPAIVNSIVLINVQSLRYQVAGFQELLQIREEGIKESEKLTKEYQKMVDQREAKPVGTENSTTTSKRLSGMLSRATRASSTPQMSEEMLLAAKLEQLEQSKEKVVNINKMLLFSEIDRFNYERTEAVNSLVGILVAANLKVAKLSMDKWTETAAMCSVVPQLYEELLPADIIKTKKDD